eukprot:GEMP01059194.1.p1 GENE.GEMP01059194.1~~GEMP01059194.1.p1  ORF type:complete len:233 (+),score=46.87 GEMP01059194.1:82-780(+)
MKKGRWRKNLDKEKENDDKAVVYATPADQPVGNIAGAFALKALRSQVALITNGSLALDVQKCLEGGAIYHPNFACAQDDYSLFNAIKSELPPETIDWSRHLKHENPELSSTFTGLQRKIEEYFDFDVFAWRLNIYPNGDAWKPFHKDSHAYSKNKGETEDFTCGISLGASRDLSFRHCESGERFSFPQHNGDAFAFTNEVLVRFVDVLDEAHAASDGKGHVNRPEHSCTPEK